MRQRPECEPSQNQNQPVLLCAQEGRSLVPAFSIILCCSFQQVSRPAPRSLF